MPRIWVTVSEEIKDFLDKEIAKKRFHNYSHAVDFIVAQFMKKEKE